MILWQQHCADPHRPVRGHRQLGVQGKKIVLPPISTYAADGESESCAYDGAATHATIANTQEITLIVASVRICANGDQIGSGRATGPGPKSKTRPTY